MFLSLIKFPQVQLSLAEKNGKMRTLVGKILMEFLNKRRKGIFQIQNFMVIKEKVNVGFSG
jgi:hypothetical protein